MSDLRARIVDALQTVAYPHTSGGVALPIERAADVLLSLPGVEIVELPELMQDRSDVAESIRAQPMWSVNGAWTSVNDEGEIELGADNQYICGTLNTSQDARDLAAALLAAARAAERAAADG